MGGYNCCVVGCGACNSHHKGLSFHRLPKKGKSPAEDEWRAKLLNTISRADKGFNENEARICSRHFDDSCFAPAGRSRTLKVGSIPTQFMPQKSIVTLPPTQRKPPTFRPPPAAVQVVSYLNFEDMKKHAQKFSLPNWALESSPKRVIFRLIQNEMVKTMLCVEEDLKCSVTIRGKNFAFCSDAVEMNGFKKTLTELQCLLLCPGISDADLQQYAKFRCDDPSSGDNYHRICFDMHMGNELPTSSVFSDRCHLVVKDTQICADCKDVKLLLERKRTRNEKEKPIHPNTSLSILPKQKLISLVKTSRLDVKKLQDLIKNKLDTAELVNVDEATHNSFQTILDSSHMESDFMKLFWEEQKKAFSTNSQGMRWHPMILRYAIMLHTFSSSTYRILRDTNILCLPGESTLCVYTNAVKSYTGVQMEVLEELKKTVSTLQEHEKYVILSHDEMQIKADLVYDSRGENLVGFTDNETWKFEEDSDMTENIATHVLVFYVMGINTSIKQSVAYFGTRNITGRDIMSMFWKVVGHLEALCKLKVIASVSDKASSNLSFYRMHCKREQQEFGISYKTRNIFARDRFIYFLSDPPNLIKTLRNCLEKSRLNGAHMWMNGSILVWDHIVDVWKKDFGKELYRSKLTSDHIHLTPRSRMNVNLAPKVMSDSTSRILKNYFPESYHGTANFLLYVDKFFDCLNSRNLDEAHRKRKPYLAAYTSQDDERFTFLQEEFLPYFLDWKKSIESRPGNFTSADRKKMFISAQTFDGLQITVKSFVEVTQYLLKQGVQFILSQKFCQDALEEHFGRHRGMGRRSENPSLNTFGYQETKIRLQRSLIRQFKPKGNVSKASTSDDNIVITNSPLKKMRFTIVVSLEDGATTSKNDCSN